MPRLIDADAIPWRSYDLDNYHWFGFEGVDKEVVDEMPTIDPESLRPHGRWLKTQEPLGWEEVDCAECSECHESWVVDMDYDYDFLEFWHYCPNCGATMDLEEENDQD